MRQRCIYSPAYLYITQRLQAELCADGHAVGRFALRSWLHRMGLKTLSIRPQRPQTMVTDPATVVAHNRLRSYPSTLTKYR